MTEQDILLRVEHLKKYFPVNRGNIFSRKKDYVYAVDDVSFEIRRGETLGLVGESGCGKSTTGRSILQLYRPSGGKILFEGQDLASLSAEEMRHMRKKIQVVFQDPYASLNPRMTVQEIVGEPLEIFGMLPRKDMHDRVAEILDMVGLDRSFANRYPHEFSGGQRQRIGIARALSVDPTFIVCDEPISALDVSVQAQVLNLMVELKHKLNLTYLFIAHDLDMVRHVSDRIAVMYLGTIVEIGASDELYTNPKHPYTRALLSAVPKPDPKSERKRKRVILEGDVPSSINPPSGCRFRTRCAYVMECCAQAKPDLFETGKNHQTACYLYKP